MMPHLFTTTAINSKKPTSKEARVGQLRYRRKGIGACQTHAENRSPRPPGCGAPGTASPGRGAEPATHLASLSL